MPSIFHASTPLAASAEIMFGFHGDPRNITHVMPPTMRINRIETDGPAREGGTIVLECADWHLIPMRWKVRWRIVRQPSLLVDEMLEGPFAHFVHEHRFDPLPDGGCVMHDTITYAFGRSWWGRLLSQTVVKLHLKLLFWFRHARTRRWAREHASG